MQVSVIKTTEPKNLSIPAAMATGGVVGLGLRYAVPVCKSEIDYVMFDKADVLKEDNVKAVKKNVIEKAQKIFNVNKEDEALDLFLKRAKAETSQEAREAKNLIKKAPVDVFKKVKVMLSDLTAQMKVSKKLTDANIKNAVKQQRPYFHFILPGVALGALVAYVYNVVGTINEE